MVENTNVEELPVVENTDVEPSLVEPTEAEDTDVEEPQVVEDTDVEPSLVELTAVEDSPRAVRRCPRPAQRHGSRAQPYGEPLPLQCSPTARYEVVEDTDAGLPLVELTAVEDTDVEEPPVVEETEVEDGHPVRHDEGPEGDEEPGGVDHSLHPLIGGAQAGASTDGTAL